MHAEEMGTGQGVVWHERKGKLALLLSMMKTLRRSKCSNRAVSCS